MQVYFGGMIRQEKKGDLALVIAESERGKGDYDAFLYSPDDPEFYHLTGVRAVHFPPERVYIGISHDAAEPILADVRWGDKPTRLSKYDADLVYSNFLSPLVDRTPELAVRQ